MAGSRCSRARASLVPVGGVHPGVRRLGTRLCCAGRRWGGPEVRARVVFPSPPTRHLPLERVLGLAQLAAHALNRIRMTTAGTGGLVVDGAAVQPAYAREYVSPSRALVPALPRTCPLPPCPSRSPSPAFLPPYRCAGRAPLPRVRVCGSWSTARRGRTRACVSVLTGFVCALPPPPTPRSGEVMLKRFSNPETALAADAVTAAVERAMAVARMKVRAGRGGAREAAAAWRLQALRPVRRSTLGFCPLLRSPPVCLARCAMCACVCAFARAQAAPEAKGAAANNYGWPAPFSMDGDRLVSALSPQRCASGGRRPASSACLLWCFLFSMSLPTCVLAQR